MDTPGQKTAVYVESIPLVEDRPSGVAHSLAGLVTELANNPAIQARYEVILVAPKRGLHKLDRWPGLKDCKRKGLPLRMRILNGLMKFHLLPPMDLLLGKGVYLFGNFKNWPVSRRSRSLTYIHDICYALYPEFVAPKNQKMLIEKVPGFIKQTNYVITVSESSRQEIMDYYHLPTKKVISLYNGVDGGLYSPYPAEDVARVKQQYGVEGEYFMFLSSIEPRKNVKSLIEAFATLPRDRSLLLVGGSGWLNEDVLALIERAKADGVRIVKPDVFVPDEDVARLLAGATALVHPAFHEGFGMTPAEAMAAGTVVIVSDIPALHEVVGEAGIYCDPHDVASIAAAMRRAVNLSAEERQRYTSLGQERAALFSWKKSAEKLINVLESTEEK